MAKFLIQTEQRFYVTYEVEAEDAREAWDELMDGNGDCDDQTPGEIIGEYENASIEEVE